MILSTPSYVIPGTYLENVRFIAEKPEIQSVELLFFIFDQETEELFDREAAEIKKFSKALGFTVHMPDELMARHEKLIDMTAEFARHYVIHPPERDRDGFLALLDEWTGRYGRKFLLENLIGREFDTLLRDLPSFHVCCDTGHLLVRGERPHQFLETYDSRLREVHLHGLEDGWDHKPFAGSLSWFVEIVPFLKNFQGICNLEVFSYADVETILDSLKYHGFPL